MSRPSEYTKLTLAERPKGPVNDKTFKVEKASFDELLSSLQADQVLIQNDYISLDPAMRGWLNDTRSYLPPVGIGQTMRASTISTVVKVGEEVKSIKPGDQVFGTGGISPSRDMSSGLTASDDRLDRIRSRKGEGSYPNQVRLVHAIAVN
jgi:NADPH-dependent curcumin reductase CurA